MGSKAGSLLRMAAPIALSLAFPGLGTAIGAGLGATGAGASALGGGLLGAGGGLLTGGHLKGALLGGLSGGLGGYLGGGGASDLFGGTDFGDALGLDNPSSGSTFGNLLSGNSDNLSGSTSTASLTGNAGHDLLGNGLQSGSGLSAGATNAPLYNVGGGGSSAYGSGLNNEFASGLAKGTGYTPPNVVALTGASMAAAPATSSSSIGSLLGKYGVSALGGAASLGSNLQAQSQLTKATKDANAQLNPYLQTGKGAEGAIGGFLGLPGGTGGSASDILAASPGYEFTRQQGNRALAAQQAASGSLNSGAAQKAAEQFGTGLANNTAQQYFSNLQGTAGQGLGAAGQYGNNTTALGSAKGAASIATGNTLAQLLSGVGGKRVIGYGADGKPIYSQG